MKSMALANATATGCAPRAEGAMDHDLGPLAAQFCDRAIDTLEDAIRAISDDDIPARCDAVSKATEAATSLFLELEAGRAAGPDRSAGRLYEAILTHLMHINVRNDIGAAIAAIRLLERLRDAGARSESPRPLALAALGPRPRSA